MGCYICRHTSCVCRCIKRRETSVCHSFLRLYGKSCEPSFRSISRLYQNTFLVVQRNLEWIKDDVNLVNSYIYPSHICNDIQTLTRTQIRRIIYCLTDNGFLQNGWLRSRGKWCHVTHRLLLILDHLNLHLYMCMFTWFWVFHCKKGMMLQIGVFAQLTLKELLLNGNSMHSTTSATLFSL